MATLDRSDSETSSSGSQETQKSQDLKNPLASKPSQNEVNPHELVCPALNIKRMDLEDCNFALLEKSRLNDPLVLNAKFLQLGGFRSHEPFEVMLHSTGEMQFCVCGTFSI